MSKFQLIYKPLGTSAILIEWPHEISREILNDIRFFVSKIEIGKYKEVIECSFVYNSLLVVYDVELTDFTAFTNKIKKIYKEDVVVKPSKRTLWEIPVCYDQEFGIDLNLMSVDKKVSIDEIVAMHAAVNYTVYGIGFLPGFLYLGGLTEKLNFPRMLVPRMEVLKGSVGIGGNQTGIYPQTSPGGWHIIGKTPITFFEVNNEIPCFIKPADEVKFIPILKEEFYSIKETCEQNLYEPKKIVLYD